MLNSSPIVGISFKPESTFSSEIDIGLELDDIETDL